MAAARRNARVVLRFCSLSLHNHRTRPARPPPAQPIPPTPTIAWWADVLERAGMVSFARMTHIEQGSFLPIPRAVTLPLYTLVLQTFSWASRRRTRLNAALYAATRSIRRWHRLDRRHGRRHLPAIALAVPGSRTCYAFSFPLAYAAYHTASPSARFLWRLRRAGGRHPPRLPRYHAATHRFMVAPETSRICAGWMKHKHLTAPQVLQASLCALPLPG